MVDFANYEAEREDGTSPRPFTFEDLEGQPGVLSRPATSANTRYNNVRMKALGKRTNQGRKKQRISVSSVNAARREDAKMLANFCVTGWLTPPVDANKNPVPFTAANCAEFFLAIPDWMFDDYRAWVIEPTNFTDDEDLDDGDDEEEAPGESRTSLQSESAGSAASTETDTPLTPQ